MTEPKAWRLPDLPRHLGRYVAKTPLANVPLANRSMSQSLDSTVISSIGRHKIVTLAYFLVAFTIMSNVSKLEVAAH
jgi:hypothetical protein